MNNLPAEHTFFSPGTQTCSETLVFGGIPVLPHQSQSNTGKKTEGRGTWRTSPKQRDGNKVRTETGNFSSEPPSEDGEL